MSIRYLNTDCILKADYSLKAITDQLRQHIFILWEEINKDSSSVGMETMLLNTKKPEDDILEYINLFEKLAPDLRQLLDDCKEKSFDVGFEGGNSGDALDTSLSQSTIQKISDLAFSLNIRIYPDC
jgi:galactokinase/mevalonate kinase-like predicted kinase